MREERALERKGVGEKEKEKEGEEGGSTVGSLYSLWSQAYTHESIIGLIH